MRHCVASNHLYILTMGGLRLLVGLRADFVGVLLLGCLEGPVGVLRESIGFCFFLVGVRSAMGSLLAASSLELFFRHFLRKICQSLHLGNRSRLYCYITLHNMENFRL